MVAEDVNAHVRLLVLGFVGVVDELEEPRPAEDAGDASLVEELADVAAGGGAELGLDGTVGLLGLSNKGAKGGVAANADDGHQGGEDADGSHGEDNVVDELGALTQVLLRQLLSEQGQEGTDIGRQVIGEVIELAGARAANSEGEDEKYHDGHGRTF